MLVGMIVKRFDEDVFKKFADVALDFIEDYVRGSETKYDDLVLLPLCKTIRAAFDIQDND